MRNCSKKSAALSEEPALAFPALGKKAGKLSRGKLSLSEITRMSEDLLLLKPVTEEELDRHRRSKSPERIVIK